MNKNYQLYLNDTKFQKIKVLVFDNFSKLKTSINSILDFDDYECYVIKRTRNLNSILLDSKLFYIACDYKNTITDLGEISPNKIIVFDETKKLVIFFKNRIKENIDFQIGNLIEIKRKI